MMADRVQDGGAHSSTPFAGDGSAEGLTPSSRRRRAPSLKEQARREEWGKEWGKVNSDHAKRLRERDG